MASSSGRDSSAARTLAGVSLKAAADILFPPRCPGCHRRGTWLCAACARVTPFVEAPRCPRCGDPMSLGCRCDDLPVSLDRLRSALWYEGWVPTAIQWFKYEGESARASFFAGYLTEELADLLPVDALVAVPLHRRRERSRGYNQSAALARELGRRSGIATARPLARERNTPRQVGLHASERAENIAGAFTIRPGVDPRGQRILLVDDVVTTGSTLGECAAVLKRAGAAWVGALTVARER